MQIEEEVCDGGGGEAAGGEDCSETVCDTVETEECYTKYESRQEGGPYTHVSRYEEKCDTVYKERGSTEYELECTTGNRKSKNERMDYW